MWRRYAWKLAGWACFTLAFVDHLFFCCAGLCWLAEWRVEVEERKATAVEHALDPDRYDFMYIPRKRLPKHLP